MMPSAIAWHSMPVSGSRSRRCKSLGKPDHRGRADLHVQVRPFPVDELLEPCVELRNDRRAVRRRRGRLLHTVFLRRWSRVPMPGGPPPPGSLPLHRTRRLRLQSEYVVRRRQRYVRGAHSRTAERRQTPERSARGSNESRRIGGRELASMPSSSPRWMAHTSSRCSSSRSRNGQSRSVMSTRARPATPEPRVEPRLGERLLQHGEVRAARATGARPRRRRPTR